MQLQFDNITLNVRPHSVHEWMLTTAEVAEGYGVSPEVIRKHKSRNADELIEGKHFVSVTNSHAVRNQADTHWTKRGVVRLGFLIKSVQAKRFRDWSEDLFLEVAEQAELPPLPLTQMELLLQTLQANVVIAQRMVETDRRVWSLEQRVERFEQIQLDAQTDLLALPAPTQALPELSVEAKIKQYVNTYSRARNLSQQEVWRLLHTELYYRYRISVNAYRLQPGESKLHMLGRVGHLDKLYVIASNILQPNP